MTGLATRVFSEQQASHRSLLEQAHRLRIHALHLERLAARVAGAESGPENVPWTDVILGDWAGAECHARTLLDPGHARVADSAATAAAQTTIAISSALRGDLLASRGAAAAAECAFGSSPETLQGARLARGIAGLAAGEPDAAYAELLPNVEGSPDRGRTAAKIGVASAGYFAEAASRCGRIPQARTAVAGLSTPDVVRDLAPGDRDELALAAALLTDPADCVRALEGALADNVRGSVVRRARLALALGMRLRRSRRVSVSRPHLRVAQDLFDVVGMRPWSVMCATELRAAGEHRLPPAPRDRLSAQEFEIAQLAARGMSNKAIGAQLQLSPRTVGSHLYRMFPKLNISSRVQLARIVDDISDRAEPTARPCGTREAPATRP